MTSRRLTPIIVYTDLEDVRAAAERLHLLRRQVEHHRLRLADLADAADDLAVVERRLRVELLDRLTDEVEAAEIHLELLEDTLAEQQAAELADAEVA